MRGDQAQVSDERVQEIARAVVIQLLLTMGVDASDPKALAELQLDFAHVRAWRLSTNLLKSKSLSAAVFFIVTAVLAYLTYVVTGKWLHY